MVTAVVALALVLLVAVVLLLPAGPEGKKAADTGPPSAAPVAAAPAPAEAKPPPSPPEAAPNPAPVAEKPAPVAQKPAPRPEAHDDASPTVIEPRREIVADEDPTGPNALILVTAVACTDPGLRRSHNEDAYVIVEDHHLFVIADGMGRHKAGEVASQLCVDAIHEAFRSGNFGDPLPVTSETPRVPKAAARLRGAITIANARILEAATSNDAYAGMGTTVVCAYFSPNKQRVYIAHVGDSRCYRLRAGKLEQLTTDHTLGAAGIGGKSAGLLSRAVGIEEVVDVDVHHEAPQPGDIYLLCSDGLSRMVTDADIEATIVAAPSLDEATRLLVEKANQQGGRDNITAILVRVEDARPQLG